MDRTNPEPRSRRLVVFLGDETSAPGLDRGVRRIFSVAWRRSPGSLGTLNPDALVLVGDPAELHDGLEALSHIPLVAVVPASRLSEPFPMRSPPAELLILGHDEYRLSGVLGRLLAPLLLTDRGRDALQRLPSLIRRSLEAILEHPVPTLVEAVEATAQGREPFPHTRDHFAMRFGCSPDYLTRVARRAGVQWADVHRRALFVRLRHHRLSTGDTWANTFMRFGIPTASSGADFVKRVTGGISPIESERIPFEDVRDEFVARIASW